MGNATTLIVLAINTHACFSTAVYAVVVCIQFQCTLFSHSAQSQCSFNQTHGQPTCTPQTVKDKSLSVGCSKSCNVLEETGDSPIATTIYHYLDFMSARRDALSCRKLITVFQTICVPIAEGKSEDQPLAGHFGGYEIATINMLIRISDSKCIELRHVLCQMVTQRKTTLQQSLSVIHLCQPRVTIHGVLSRLASEDVSDREIDVSELKLSR